MHAEHVHDRCHERDRCEVLHRVVVDLAVQRGRNAQRRCGEQHGVAVRCRLGDELGRDHRARAGLVLDDHGLAEAVLQTLGQRARHDVGGTARRERHDDGDRLARVVAALCISRSADGCSRDGDGGDDVLDDHGCLSPLGFRVGKCVVVHLSAGSTSASSMHTPWPCCLTSRGFTSTSSACSCSASTAREKPAMAAHAASTSPIGRPR